MGLKCSPSVSSDLLGLLQTINQISPELCGVLAHELRRDLLPVLETSDNPDLYEYAVSCYLFIKDCEAAHAANEPLIFS
jgi:hypothetical protein